MTRAHYPEVPVQADSDGGGCYTSRAPSTGPSHGMPHDAPSIATPRPSRSRAGLFTLLAAAVLCSAVTLVAERVQAPSYYWSVEGGMVRCTAARPPFESADRTYDPARVRKVTGAVHDSIPGGKVVRFEMSGLNYHIPAQNSRGIPGFDRYVEDLDAFMARARAGDATARLRRLSRGLQVMTVGAVAAVVLWIAVFAAVLRPRR